MTRRKQNKVKSITHALASSNGYYKDGKDKLVNFDFNQTNNKSSSTNNISNNDIDKIDSIINNTITSNNNINYEINSANFSHNFEMNFFMTT